jgi:DNA helicase HerA-like ATPase
LRANPKFDAETAITELGVGEALVSFLDEKGRPNVVERAFILPPASRIGPQTAEERQAVIKSSAIYGHYEKAVDRESAYEKLKGAALHRRMAGQPTAGEPAPAAAGGGWLGSLGDLFGGGGWRPDGRGDSVIETAAKSAARAIGSQVGREIIRGVLGSILGGGSRRR